MPARLRALARGIFPLLGALGLVLVTLLEWREQRGVLREHRAACEDFARAHDREVEGLCTDAVANRVLPRLASARKALSTYGVKAVPYALDEAEAIDREPSRIASLVATSLFRDALDLLEAPANADFRRSFLRRRHLRSPAEVLEARRLATQTRDDARTPRARLDLWLAQHGPRLDEETKPTQAILVAKKERERLSLRATVAARLAALRRS